MPGMCAYGRFAYPSPIISDFSVGNEKQTRSNGAGLDSTPLSDKISRKIARKIISLDVRWKKCPGFDLVANFSLRITENFHTISVGFRRLSRDF